MQLTAEEVLQLSPDDSSAKAAKGLVVPAKWPRLELNEQAVWGECQGSGSKPYQVQVDRAGPAFRCSCPSRKFPCKHGLALLLLLAQHPAKFSQAETPAWVAEWLASRQQRADKQEQKKAAPPAEVDPEAGARREAARRARMQAGMDDLSRWLEDRLRQGLAQLPGQSEIWGEMATRMVDAQLPGLAYRLRRIGGAVGRGDAWTAQVLGAMGRLHLLCETFGRLEGLPAPTQADVRNALGLPAERDQVLAVGERVDDDWLVLGQANDEEDRLWVRRVWLYGQRSGRHALLLDYAHGTRRFERSFITGSSLGLTLAFFPGNSPLRALVAADLSRQMRDVLPPAQTLQAALAGVATRIAANPWQFPLPLLYGDGVPERLGATWGLRVGEQCMPLQVRDQDGWLLVAEAGGAPLTIFGEWDGVSLRPLTAWNARLRWFEEVGAE